MWQKETKRKAAENTFLKLFNDSVRKYGADEEIMGPSSSAIIYDPPAALSVKAFVLILMATDLQFTAASSGRHTTVKKHFESIYRLKMNGTNNRA